MASLLQAQIGDAVWRKGWWVHIEPAGSGTNVVRYLARYVSRTAISDDRIVAANDHAVTFRYTDSVTKKRKECTLTAEAFMRPSPRGWICRPNTIRITADHYPVFPGLVQPESCVGCCDTELSELGVSSVAH